MPRYTGDYQGRCQACDEDVELAIGIQTDRAPVAMHFGPGGPQPVLLHDVQLVAMIDDSLDVKFTCTCPLCGGLTPGRATCRPVPSPGEATGS